MILYYEFSDISYSLFIYLYFISYILIFSDTLKICHFDCYRKIDVIYQIWIRCITHTTFCSVNYYDGTCIFAIYETFGRF